MDEPMKKWQIAVSILLIFALGTAAGAYGSRVVFKKRVSKALKSEGTPGIRVIQGMVGRLDLSESQRAAINAIVEENNEKWESIRQEYGPKIEALFETVIEETKKELTPEQREEIENMSANVQRRLPRRSNSPPRSAGPPEGSTSPDASMPPRSPGPPESSGPPDKDQPYVPPPNSDRVAAILDELGADPEKSAALRTIIETDLETQDALWEAFQQSQAAAEDNFRKEQEGVQLETEKKLENLLTPEQMETYRQLTRREEPPPDDFMFDIPGDTRGDTRERKNFRQEEMQTPAGGEFGNTQAYLTL
jgi:Spy/CpxP family protein refolding chaperone